MSIPTHITLNPLWQHIARGTVFSHPTIGYAWVKVRVSPDGDQFTVVCYPGREDMAHIQAVYAFDVILFCIVGGPTLPQLLNEVLKDCYAYLKRMEVEE